MNRIWDYLKYLLHYILMFFLFFGLPVWVFLLIGYICISLGASQAVSLIVSSVIVVLMITTITAVNYVSESTEKAISDYEKKYNKTLDDLAKREQILSKRQYEFDVLLSEKQQTYPWMAQQIADFLYLQDESISTALRTKAHPALKASDEVKKIAKEKRNLESRCKQLEYQLAYYEFLVPWLEEFKEIPPITGANYINDYVSNSSENEYESLKEWISPEEYANLSTAEKYQLALERYLKRKKDDWEVGIEYERYIGYLYEKQGYKVQYVGALKGKQDMGRDVIAIKDGKTLVIQCKRWAKEKTIHEKHIFQLYGTSILMKIEDGADCYPVFITTATLSDTARKCATYLKVGVVENYAYQDYPMIKCNISRSGEKIYHLPFDQQYDKVRISVKDGEQYVQTTKDAEALGFRRAYRWHGDKNGS